MNLPDTHTATLERQLGLLTRSQLGAAGVGAETLRWRLGRGWTLVLPQVVSTRPEPLTSSQRLVAAVLEAGLAAMVTGHHACSWHGLTSTRVDRPVEVLVPMTQAARRVGFITVRRTRRLDVCALRRPPLIVASRARSVIDAARSARSDDEARAVVIEAAQRRLVQLAELEHEVEAGATRDSARARRAVRDVRAGAWSVPEAELLQLCAGSAVLPSVYANPELEAPDGAVLVSPDVWVDDIAMALMVHSRAHHARDADWEGTVEQDGALAEHGVIVLAFTAGSVSRDPARVLRRIERAYTSARASRRERPAVRMAPRGWGLSDR